MDWTPLWWFFKQGDREKEVGKDILLLMNSKIVNIAGSYIGFSKMIVQSEFEALVI